MSEKDKDQIKYNLCRYCGERCTCHGIQSCKDANEYIKKLGDRK